MSKFYYQDKAYEVPSVEYCDLDTVIEALGRIPSCSCSVLLKNQDCKGILCSDCIFSHYNPAARFEYLKMKGIVKMENNDTMKENKTIEEFLRPGVLFKTESGHWYMHICNTYSYQIVLVDGHPAMQATTSVKQPSITEAYYAPTLFTYTIKDIIDGTCKASNPNIAVWKRPDPVKEMTMSDLEKHFGCKVKIVKES